MAAPGVGHDGAHYLPPGLNTILGGSSSRCFEEIREERGLAYSAYSCETTRNDPGLLGVFAGMSPRCVREVVDIITRESEAVRREGIRPEELGRTEEQLNGNLDPGLESASGRVSRLGRQELCLRQVESPDEVIAGRDGVEFHQAREFTVAPPCPEELAQAAIGPVPKEAELPGMLLPCGSWRRGGLAAPRNCPCPPATPPAPLAWPRWRPWRGRWSWPRGAAAGARRTFPGHPRGARGAGAPARRDGPAPWDHAAADSRHRRGGLPGGGQGAAGEAGTRALHRAPRRPPRTAGFRPGGAGQAGRGGGAGGDLAGGGWLRTPGGESRQTIG